MHWSSLRAFGLLQLGKTWLSTVKQKIQMYSVAALSLEQTDGEAAKGCNGCFCHRRHSWLVIVHTSWPQCNNHYTSTSPRTSNITRRRLYPAGHGDGVHAATRIIKLTPPIWKPPIKLWVLYVTSSEVTPYTKIASWAVQTDQKLSCTQRSRVAPYTDRE